VIFDRADVLRENTEAVFAACDAAHGRWAKLLGVRAVLHPKLRLVEFLSIYNITQEFITATEKVLYSFLYHEKNFMFMSVMLFVR
jgi:vacuolar protein sorting-associated protein 54